MDETWWRNPSQLDDDQKKLIDLPLERNHLIVGPPGSGKTNLLLLRATYLTRAGFPNISVITFNRLLSEFLHTGASLYPFKSSVIQTFRSWALSTLKNNGVRVDTNCDFPEQRIRIVAALEELLKDSDSNLKLDCIFIDESQDYYTDELNLMRALSDRVFAVGDDNQRIYEASGALNYLASFCDKAPPLEYHYRNGMDICRMADGIMNVTDGGMVDSCNYDEDKYPSKVEYHGGLSLKDQVAKSIDYLERQLLAYPDEWIGVLAPRRADVNEVYEFLSSSKVGDKVQLQKYEDGYESLSRSTPIIVSTMHAAKGLEYRAVHVFALEQVKKLDNAQRLAFTAVTRAKTSLVLYYNANPPGYIERGLVAVDGRPTKPPVLADLFGDTP